jgi:toxin ParE1/3/4
MSRLERTPRAELDLLQIWVYVAERNFPAAEKLLARIEATIELLAAQPMMGERLDGISAGLRRFIVGEYLIAYRPLEDGIRVLRVVHGARDFQRLIDEVGDEGR